jgi:Protein of unknown function (DUF3185)
MSARTLGIALFVVGLLLVAFGLNATHSLSDSVSEGVTGRYTDRTMWYLIGGGAIAVGGIALALTGRRGTRRV